MSSLTKAYYPEINIARGIALIAVVIGHSFPYVDTNKILSASPISGWIYTFMYSFHMGLFFILAGFVSGETLYKAKIDLFPSLKKKFQRLVIPYLMFSFIVIPLKLIFSKYVNNKFELSQVLIDILIGNSPCKVLWFLWTLFFLYALFMIANQFKQSLLSFIIIGIFLQILNIFLPVAFYSKILYWSLYFVIGIVCRYCYNSIKPFLLTFNVKIGSLISFVLVAWLAYIGAGPYWLKCFLMSMSIMCLCCLLSSKSWYFHALDELGKYSYDIYLISYFVQVFLRSLLHNILHLQYWVVFSFMAFFGVFLSYIISKYFIRKIAIANRFLLGNI